MVTGGFALLQIRPQPLYQFAPTSFNLFVIAEQIPFLSKLYYISTNMDFFSESNAYLWKHAKLLWNALAYFYLERDNKYKFDEFKETGNKTIIQEGKWKMERNNSFNFRKKPMNRQLFVN